jgi:hypothetical protein
MRNEGIDEIVPSPRGAISQPLETENLADAIIPRGNQEANTRFPHTYLPAGVEVEDVDEMVAPHRAPLPQRHDHGSGLREHAEGSEYRTRTGDLRQSNPKPTSPKNAGEIASRLEALTASSSSTHNNVTTPARMRVDLKANSSLPPIYQADGPEMEDVDEGVAPRRIPLTLQSDGAGPKKNSDKSGRDVRALSA